MNHTQKSEKLLANIVIIGLGTILTKLISFIMTPFYAQWLSVEDYGTYDLIATYISLCVPLATLQLDQAIYRFSMERPNESNAVYRTVLKITLPLFLGVPVVITAVMNALKFDLLTIGSFICYFISLGLYNLSSEYLRGNNHLREYSFCNILVGGTTVLFSYLLVRRLSFKVPGMLASFAVAYSITLAVILLRFKPYAKKTEKLYYTPKQLLDYSVPLIPNSISWWITNVSDRTIINIFHGSFSNGIYAISCKIPTILSLIFSVFNLSFQQVAIQSNNDEDINEYYSRLMKKTIALLFTGSSIIVALTPFLYKLFLNKDYWSGLNCVPILLGGAIMLSLAQYVGDILLVEKETKAIGISTVAGACLNIILNLVLIPTFDVLGASIATLMSYILMFFFRIVKVKDRLNVKILLESFSKYCCFFVAISLGIVFCKLNLFIGVIVLIISTSVFFVANFEIIHSTVQTVLRRLK